jgi:hypothetical protein
MDRKTTLILVGTLLLAISADWFLTPLRNYILLACFSLKHLAIEELKRCRRHAIC